MIVKCCTFRFVAVGFAALSIAYFASWSFAADAPPRVLGFDRAYTSSHTNRVVA